MSEVCVHCGEEIIKRRYNFWPHSGVWVHAATGLNPCAADDTKLAWPAKPLPTDPELAKALEATRYHVMAPEEKQEQRISFAAGNLAMSTGESVEIVKERVRKADAEMRGASAEPLRPTNADLLCEFTNHGITDERYAELYTEILDRMNRGNEPLKGVMTTDHDQKPVGSATPPTGVVAGASVGAQCLKHQNKPAAWCHDCLGETFKSILEVVASLQAELAGESALNKAHELEIDRLRDMYNEQMRLKDEYKGFLRAAERQMAEAGPGRPQKRFPFRVDDYIQHVGGTGNVFVIRGVDDETFEAWAEVAYPYTGKGTRVINPDNWKKVKKPETER